MKRYDYESGDKCGGEYEGCLPDMVEHNTGEYVLWEDVQDVLRDIDAARDALTDIIRQLS